MVAWLARHKRFQFHFTSTYSSWLNQVERWFGIITEKAIRRGSFKNVKQLVEKTKLDQLQVTEKINKLSEEKNVTKEVAALWVGKEYVQTIMRIGPLAIIPFPGELFSGISLRLRKLSPFAYTLCASVSNGYFTYIPTQEALHRKGYEIWMAKAYNGYGLADDIDDKLIEQNLKLLRKAFNTL